MTQIRQTLVPLSNRGGVPTFTVDRALYCKVRITNSQNQSQIHSLFLLYIPSSRWATCLLGLLLLYLIIRSLTDSGTAVNNSNTQSVTHAYTILFTNSIKIQSLDLIHPLSHRAIVHTLTISYTHLFTHKFTPPEAYQFVCALNQSSIHRLAQSFTFIFTQSFNQSQVRSRPSSIGHAIIHSFSLLTHTDLVYLSFV